MSYLKKWRNQLEQFFFAEEIPYGLAIIRICLPIVLLFTVVHRWPYAREIYSLEGATAQLSVNMGNVPILPEFSGNLCVWLFTLLVVTLVTSCIGWCTRISIFTSLVLYTYFSLLDSLSSVTKYTVISDHMLLILAFSPCGKIWSVDAWLETRKMTETQKLNRKILFPAWNRRLIQIMIAVIYFGAGATKIQTPAFFNGDQMKYWVVTHFNYDHPLGEMLVLFPGLLAVCGFIVLIWELAFIFLVWRRFERVLCIGMGVFFHLMTSFMLGLYTFPCVCYNSYFSFLDTQDVENIKSWWKNRVENSSFFRATQETFLEIRNGLALIFTRTPAIFWNPLMLGIIIPVVCTAGLLIEHKMDRFGLRRPEGKYRLQQVDKELVQHMIRGADKIRESDKVFSFNVGVFTLCDNVFDCKPIFKQGTKILAQASLTPPHGDVLLECNLLNEQGAVLSQVQKFVTREEARATFTYPVCENTMPGKYSLLLRCNGADVEKRDIEITSNGSKPKPFSLTSTESDYR